MKNIPKKIKPKSTYTNSLSFCAHTSIHFSQKTLTLCSFSLIWGKLFTNNLNSKEKKKCVRFFTPKVGNVGTRLEWSSGKWCLPNTTKIQLGSTRETQIYSSREPMKQAAVTMFLVLFSWIWNLVPWTASDLVPTARSSGPTTSFSAN